MDQKYHGLVERACLVKSSIGSNEHPPSASLISAEEIKERSQDKMLQNSWQGLGFGVWGIQAHFYSHLQEDNPDYRAKSRAWSK